MPTMRETIRADFAINHDWITRSVLAVFRFGQWTYRRGGPVGRLLAIPYKLVNLVLLRLLVGIDLPRGTEIGPALRLHHAGRGVTVHRRARLGSRVTLFQDVSIGQRDDSGEPVIEDGALIGVGARVLGPVHIGAGAQVGANAVVLDDVPAGGRALAPKATIREAA